MRGKIISRLLMARPPKSMNGWSFSPLKPIPAYSWMSAAAFSLKNGWMRAKGTMRSG